MQNEPKLTSLSRDTSLGQYKLREILGSDEFSITYNAWDTKRYRLLIIKEYFPNKIAIRDDKTLTIEACVGHKDEYLNGLQLFLTTAKTIATFNHPNIDKVLDYFQLNNTAYLCTPHEQGKTLDKILIQRGGTLPEQELKPISIAIISALQYAHNHNFYLNNITLSNIFIRTQGEHFIIKFDNIHQATEANLNEAAIEKTLNARHSWHDLLAFGSIIYQCISGQEPIDILSRQKIITKDNIDPLKPATEVGRNQYSVEFLELIDWMLTPEQNSGPQNADRVLEKLDNILAITKINNPQPAVTKNTDDNYLQNETSSTPIPTPDIVSINEQTIHTSHSKKTSITAPPIVPKTEPGISSFSTILWFVITSTIVIALILLGLSLQQPLQQTISDKSNTDHQLDSEVTKTKTLKLKTSKENQITERLGKSSLQKDIKNKQEASSKQLLEITMQNRVNEEIANIEKQRIINSTNQENISEHPFNTQTQSLIKQDLIEGISPSQQISSLLLSAKNDIKQLRLSTPKNRNALEKYQKILQLSPNNEEALQGLTLIIEKYLQLVKIKQQQQNYGIAKRYLNKAKMIQPNNPTVIEAENSLKTIETTGQQSQTNTLNYTKSPLEIKMVWIGPACFQMGDNEIYASEHEVCLTKGYYLGKYEVTQSQWHHVMNNNPSAEKGNNMPVQNISWNEVQTFIRKLNDLTGKHYRLPTEAEWEFACRNGGKKIKYCGSNNANRVAWYKDNSDSKIHPIGQKQPNSLGLYDMSGNVWEWVQDWYRADYYSNSPIDNPRGPFEGSGHVVRGGSWFSGKSVLRSAYRVWYRPNIHVSYLGFRLAR